MKLTDAIAKQLSERISQLARALWHITALEPKMGVVSAFAAIIVSERDPNFARYYIALSAIASVIVWLFSFQASHRDLKVPTVDATVFLLSVSLYPFLVPEQFRLAIAIAATWLALSSGFLTLFVTASKLGRLKITCHVLAIPGDKPKPIENASVAASNGHDLVSAVTNENGEAEIFLPWPIKEQLLLITASHTDFCKVPTYQVRDGVENWVPLQSVQLVYRKGVGVGYYNQFDIAEEFLSSIGKKPVSRPPSLEEMKFHNVLGTGGEHLFLWLVDQAKSNLAIDLSTHVVRVVSCDASVRVGVSVTPIANSSRLMRFDPKATPPESVTVEKQIEPSPVSTLQLGQPVLLNLFLRKKPGTILKQEVVELVFYSEYAQGDTELFIIPLLVTTG